MSGFSPILSNARQVTCRIIICRPSMPLAQLAATGCFGGAFYASAEDQLDTLRTLVAELEDNTFLAKLTIYSRERALMKDMPAALLVMLSKRDPRLAQRTCGSIRETPSSAWPSGWPSTAVVEPTVRCRWPRSTSRCAIGSSPAACW